MPNSPSEQLIHSIALSLADQVGPQKAHQLIAYCGSPQAVLETPRSALLRIPGVGERTASGICNPQNYQKAERELRFVQKHAIQALTYDDPDYPPALRPCPDAPLVLYYRSHKPFPAPGSKWLSIVGTRRATDYGREFVTRLIHDLHQRGHQLTIVSGLAHGIDGQAHRCALDNGYPTIGVLGHGLADFYPSGHRNLALRMLDNGGLLTEYTSAQHAERSTFLQRNRIIAGLATATIVVESNIAGGAMHTAAFATAYKRTLLALPGDIGQERSAGCNLLIKQQQAHLIENADDLEALLDWQTKSPAQPDTPSLFYTPTPEEQELLEAIRTHGPLPLDELLRAVSLPVSRVNSLLLRLEFQGCVRQLPGRVYKACS